MMSVLPLNVVICPSVLNRRYARKVPCSARFVFATALAFLNTASFAAAATIGPGYSAMWYDPARSGEGLQLEILDASTALVEWYTYDEHGGQRWIQGVGQIVHDESGDSIKFPQLYDTHGGRFGPNFDPDDVQRSVVGDATLVFADCNTGEFTYHAYGQSQTLPMQRLTQTMGAGCAPINGIPGQPVMAYAGQSGSWYDTSRSGEGFALQWLARGQAVVTWYTYDTQGNQVWLLGVGTEQDGAIVFEHMEISSGTHFGTAFDPAEVRKVDWGTLTLHLDCHGGTAHYASKQAAFGTGVLTLTRLTTLAQPACPTVKPKLSDLYDITWDEIPITKGTPIHPNRIAAYSIANDGTVAARRGNLVLWHPETRTWEDVPRALAALSVEISPDGALVVATEDFNIGETEPDSHTLLWQRTTGWKELPGLNVSSHFAVSQNFEYVVGIGRDAWEGGDSTWVQAIDGTQQLLPTSDAVPGGIPYAVSNNGKTVVGITLRQQNGFPTPIAVRWDIGGAPSILHDLTGKELMAATACDAECDMIFGIGSYNKANPDGGAWYLKSDGTFAYLGTPPDSPDRGSSGVADVTPDGSLAVGSYDAYANPDQPDNRKLTTRPFIWTQATGIVSMRTLVDELKIGDDDWGYFNVIDVSADGHKILISGEHPLHPYSVVHSRAVVLHLTPKVDAD